MVIDSFGAQRFQEHSFDVNVTKRASTAPTITLRDENRTIPITSTSDVYLTATAFDEDGSIDNLQFYVNGKKFGDRIDFDSSQLMDDYPYSIKWSPESNGSFIAGDEDNFMVYAKAIDTSGNEVMSLPLLYQVTRGGNNIPTLSMEKLSEEYEAGTTIFLAAKGLQILTKMAMKVLLMRYRLW